MFKNLMTITLIGAALVGCGDTELQATKRVAKDQSPVIGRSVNDQDKDTIPTSDLRMIQNWEAQRSGGNSYWSILAR